MTDKQPKALRLADAVCDYTRCGCETPEAATLRRQKTHKEAAAELRRLHEVNAELVEAVRAALSDDQPYIERCKAALVKATGENNG